MGTSASAERRDLPRRPFHGTVVLAHPDDSEGYEADAVDLSVGGMSLRTQLLPERGSELECRFVLETGEAVEARGEVVWANDTGRDAGAFGLRFTDLDPNAERAIRDSISAAAPHAAREAAAPRGDESKAKIHIAGMGQPLRARVRTKQDDVIVLGSDLSFLKVGEGVEVERAGDRVPGNLEDVSIEVDPLTHVACLVLTIALGRNAEASEPALAPAPLASARTTRRAAQATEVLPPAAAEHAASASAPTISAKAASPTEHCDRAEPAESPEAPARAAPPAWLVSLVKGLRTGGRALALRALPALKKLSAAIVSFVALCVGKLRARAGTSVPATAPAAGLRRQQSSAHRAVEAQPAAPAPRKNLGLYVLAAAGAVAIVVALTTGSKQPRPRTPRPQAAVASPAEPAPSESAPSAGTESGNGDPNTASASSTEPALPSEMTAADAAPERTSSTASRPLPAARSAMPVDLVGAARSRSANVEEYAPIVRGVPRSSYGSPGPARVAAVATPTARPAAVPAMSARVVGNASVTTGTLLRLRMDGPVTSLVGGPGAGNTITLRVAGRRSLDMAAPLVRQDARLMNAGVFNRATGAELVLRFRGPVPAFSARARGNTVEVVLAPSRPLIGQRRRP